MNGCKQQMNVNIHECPGPAGHECLFGGVTPNILGGGGGGVDGIPFIKKIEKREAAQDHQDLLAAAWLVE